MIISLLKRTSEPAKKTKIMEKIPQPELTESTNFRTRSRSGEFCGVVSGFSLSINNNLLSGNKHFINETIADARANVGAAKALKMKMINEMLGAEGV
jgi:hypothetical protein